jgi:hypothetical protein
MNYLPACSNRPKTFKLNQTLRKYAILSIAASLTVNGSMTRVAAATLVDNFVAMSIRF